MIFMDMIYGKVDIKAFTTPLLMGANWMTPQQEDKAIAQTT
jgi:hypothetical protein